MKARERRRKRAARGKTGKPRRKRRKIRKVKAGLWLLWPSIDQAQSPFWSPKLLRTPMQAHFQAQFNLGSSTVHLAHASQAQINLGPRHIQSPVLFTITIHRPKPVGPVTMHPPHPRTVSISSAVKVTISMVESSTLAWTTSVRFHEHNSNFSQTRVFIYIFVLIYVINYICE